MSVKIQVLILAAGSSHRFGNSPKQLARIGNKQLINRVLENYLSEQIQLAAINAVTVILGAHAKDISRILPNSIQVHIADNWTLGMGASLASAMHEIPKDISHVLVALGDQPEISSQSILGLISACEKNPDRIIAAAYAKSVGVPAIFPRAFFAELKRLENDRGARDILRARPDELIQIPMPEAAVDIDTPEDLQQYKLDSL